MMEQEQMNREYKVGDLFYYLGWGKCIILKTFPAEENPFIQGAMKPWLKVYCFSREKTIIVSSYYPYVMQS